MIPHQEKSASLQMHTRQLEAKLIAQVAARPALRGVFHQYGFSVALALGAFMVWRAPTPRAMLAMAIYVSSLCALLGVSTLYHRIGWRPRALLRMRRLDHAMIFVLIAGSCTPYAILIMRGRGMILVLSIVWGLALVGIVVKQIWIRGPKWFSSVLYVASGVAGALILMPRMLDRLGVPPIIWLGVGGSLYITGAVVYALRWPDPVPRIFGYHEIFHALVILAAAMHMAVIIIFVVPLEG